MITFDPLTVPFGPKVSDAGSTHLCWGQRVAPGKNVIRTKLDCIRQLVYGQSRTSAEIMRLTRSTRSGAQKGESLGRESTQVLYSEGQGTGGRRLFELKSTDFGAVEVLLILRFF